VNRYKTLAVQRWNNANLSKNSCVVQLQLKIATGEDFNASRTHRGISENAMRPARAAEVQRDFEIVSRPETSTIALS
jgi:hypothetical protein